MRPAPGRAIALLLVLFAVLALWPANAGALTAGEYETAFRRALTADAERNNAYVQQGPSQNRDLRAGIERQRQIARLASIAAEGLSYRPGDLNALLSGLKQAAPEHAAAVGDHLRGSFPGFAPTILATLGTAAPAPALSAASSRLSYRAPPLLSRPSREASQAAATAVARIAASPANLSQAVAEAVAAVPNERVAVAAAVAQAFPGFSDRIHAAAGVAPATDPSIPIQAASGLTVAPVSPAPLSRPAAKLELEPEDDIDGIADIGPDDDPIEPFNRVIFAINDALDTVILRPIAIGYNAVMPDPAILAVRRFFLNLNSPVIFANDVLQTDFEDAGVTLGRFAVNSTVGVLGLFDPATSMGLERHHADFGQTLHSYGVGGGPYIMLPLFGPSNARDAVGRVVDTVTDPLFWLLDTTPSLILAGTRAVSAREELLQPLDELKASSVDYYSAVKSAYTQNRRVELNKGRPLAGGGADYDRLFDETLPSLDE